MLHNIDTKKMNQLMESNKDARDIINQLLENHRINVSTISHEIRNPLTLVFSSLQMMEMQHPEVKNFAHWEQTLSDVEFMCQLLNELSSFNNGEHLTYSPFSLNKLIKNVSISFAISLEDSDIEYVSNVDKAITTFTGDKHKLQEVLLNLLRNARDAVSDGGHIYLDASRRRDQIVIECRDDGCGIEAEKLDSIFEPFTTYKKDGTGLGLAISKRIVESHGGTLTVNSTPYKGSTFTVALPL
ncbi:MAG: HAMP domain-containing sensor histidine kinase [Hespellia sp.]|nr:HAMP domain-containing sensor histidine kinase [Hespellia sp.]